VTLKKHGVGEIIQVDTNDEKKTEEEEQ